jgi:ParB-like chromosome segregation protein Spo0J
MPDETTERFSQAWWEQRLPQRLNGTSWQTIGETESIPEPTMRRNRRKAEQLGWIPVNESLPAPMKSDGRRASSRRPKPQEMPMPEETADTGVIHTGAVGEFLALPEGYAKVIQPMRPYCDAEEFALNESMRLFGFVGAIVYDQYGRILDGHHRQRVARLRGLGVPYTIAQVRDDAHAIALATSLNAVRRQYPRKEREQIALAMRDQGFSYRVIAAALGVSKDTVQRDILGNFQIIPAPKAEVEIVSDETISSNAHETIVSSETISQTGHERRSEIVSDETISAIEPPTPAQTSEQVKRVQRKGGGTYPAQRLMAQKAPKPSAGDEGTTAQRWYSRLLREFSQMDRMIEQFQSEGGVSVLGRQLSQGMRDSLLGDLRGKAKMLREMADYLETITREPSHTSEMFGRVEMPSMSPTTAALDSPEEKGD